MSASGLVQAAQFMSARSDVEAVVYHHPSTPLPADWQAEIDAAGVTVVAHDSATPNTASVEYRDELEVNDDDDWDDEE